MLTFCLLSGRRVEDGATYLCRILRPGALWEWSADPAIAMRMTHAEALAVARTMPFDSCPAVFLVPAPEVQS